MTRVSSLNTYLDAKRLELITEVVLGVRRVAVLALASDPETPAMASALDTAARTRGVQLQLLEIPDRFASTVLLLTPRKLALVPS